MKCQHVTVDGVSAIVCGQGPTQRCACGQGALFLCDWKIGQDRTCDRPLCGSHAFIPHQATNKHLCEAHAKVWETDPRNPNGIAMGDGRR